MRMPVVLVLLLAGCISAAALAEGPGGKTRSDPLPPPAPAGGPEAQEAEAALAAGSNAALIRFLARHGDDPQAPRIRQALAARGPDSTGQAAAADPDAAVIAAFDAARLAGNAAAWSAFQGRYPTHPLAAEAERWR